MTNSRHGEAPWRGEQAFAGIERTYGATNTDPRSTRHEDAYRRARNDALRRAGVTVVEP